MKNIFILVCLLLSSIAKGQKINFEMRLNDFVTNKPLKDVLIQVYEGDKIIFSDLSTKNKYTKFVLPTGKAYDMVFSKEGKVSRRLSVNGKNCPDSEGIGDKITFEINFFDRLPETDYAEIENFPITEFYCDGNPGFAFDSDLANQMWKKIEAVMTEQPKNK